MKIDFDPGESITNPFGERFFPKVSGNLFAKSSSATIFGRYFKETFKQEDTLFIIGGTDSGLLPFYLAEHFKEKRGGRKFIFIDYSSVFNDIDISTLPDWIECYPADFPMGILSQSEVEYMASGKIALIKSLAIIDSKYEDAYGQLLAHIEEEFRKLMFAENVTSATRSFIDAQLLNVHRNIRPIKLLRGKLKKRDVLMIGGGPSLDDSIGWIKENADKFIIFAAGRTSPRLLQEGIQPDFLVSVDPHDLSFDNSKRMLEFNENTILMNCHHINPKLLNQWALNSVYFGERLPWGEPEENSSSPGPTVIHSALHQAVFMGATNVYLTGVDLCFYKGKTHASGSAESKIGKLGVKQLTHVETYSGDIAETDQAFSSGVDSLAWLVKGYETHSPDCSVYNLCEYAAKVEGVEYKDKSDVELSGLKNKFDLMKEINQILNVDLEEMVKHLNMQMTEFQNIQEILEEGVKLSNQGLSLSEEYHDDSKSSDKIIQIKDKLDNKLGDMGEMLYHYGYDYFRDLFRPVEDEVNMSENEITLTLKSFFKGMKQSCGDFILQLEKSIKVLENRLQEFKPDSRPEKLLPIWINHFETGRYKIWQKYHPNSSVTIQDQEALDQASEIFKKNLAFLDTQQAKLFKERSLSPVELHTKVLKAFDKHDIESLKEIQQQLNKVDSFDGQQLAVLVKGILAEMNGDNAEAIDAFQQIEFKPFKLFALKHLLDFSMKADEHEQVLIYLEGLCEFSLEYMLPYSDYLALLGQDEFAYAVMDSFTKRMPEHFSGFLKLAELALKTGKTPEALQALEAAKDLDSDNPQVKKMIELLKPK